MPPLRRCSFALLPLAAASGAAFAAAPRFGCYERIYSAVETAGDPGQAVRHMTVRVGRPQIGDPEQGFTAGIDIAVYFFDRKSRWSTGGGCVKKGGALECGFDGDHGWVIARAAGDRLRLEIPNYIALGADEPEGDVNLVKLGGGAHRISILQRAAPSACATKR
ncbi:hypothetical protein [Terrarubrum flagellatum]|uniref:hypothetical protein n=1 Tax=Terrirubrum flagellatum TaxID=2895980 RepID=UPI0031454655